MVFHFNIRVPEIKNPLFFVFHRWMLLFTPSVISYVNLFLKCLHLTVEKTMLSMILLRNLDRSENHNKPTAPNKLLSSCPIFYIFTYSIYSITHSIVVLSFNKVIHLFYFPMFKYFFCFKSKFFNVVIYLVTGKCGSWLIMLEWRLFKNQSTGKILQEPRPLKVDWHYCTLLGC